nr:MAG: NS1 [Canine parvovirus]
MQAKVECARRCLSTLRGSYWSHGKCVEAEQKIMCADGYLQRVLRTWDAGTWKAAVMQIAIFGEEPIQDPHPYCFLLDQMPMNTDWLMTAEFNDDDVFHVHALVRNPQRTDAWIRSANNRWFTCRAAAINDIGDKDPLLSVMKCQTAHKPSALLEYMVKSPVWCAANNLDNLRIIQDLHSRDAGARFRAGKKKSTVDSSINQMTSDILDIIGDHGCKSLEDVFRSAPDTVKAYLHRPGFAQIVNTCLTWAQVTQGGWSLQKLNAKYQPDPTAIHTVLLHQGIIPSDFDKDFYAWVSGTSDKKNTFVLWGPSNTGKSMFIKGFKEAVPWGEIVNGNSFGFEGLIGNKFGVWEEPLISAEAAEKCKQIFEGMETSIPVKYKKPHKLQRTPIIITTNHAPWRYCTNEEVMFSNRMFIYNWNYSATDSFACRTSEHRCQCRVCKASRGAEDPSDGGQASGMQGEEQSQQLLVSGDGQPAGDVWTRPVCPRSTGTCRGYPGCYDPGFGTSTSGPSVQCPHGSGPRCGTCTTVEHCVRSDWEYRSSNSRKRIRSTESGGIEPMESEQYRGSDGGDMGGDGVGSDGSSDADTSDHNSRRDRGQRQDWEAVVVLGGEDKESQTEVSSTESGLGGEMGTLKIPTKSDWNNYLSYLYKTYWW